jgi:methylmalonyl-CoA mutase, N-terminal domain
VNEYVVNEEPPEILRIGESVREWQTGKLERLRARRSSQAVARSLDALQHALALPHQGCRGSLSGANTMPYLLDCVRAYATLGEICDAMRAVLGTYQEAGVS